MVMASEKEELAIPQPYDCLPKHLAGTVVRRRAHSSRARRIEVIPLGLDLDLFKPLDRSFARTALNLPPDKTIVAMGALGSTTDPRKGFEHLVRAIRIMASQGWAADTELVVFGASQTSDHRDIGFPTTFIGMLNDEWSLALVYSAADVFVAPSLQENFCQTVLESLACGDSGRGVQYRWDVRSHRARSDRIPGACF